MSAFVGAVLLEHDVGELPRELSLPDEPWLDPPRLTTSAVASLVHRQRVVTPQDRGELQPWRRPDGAGWVAFAGRLDDRAALASALDLGRSDDTADGVLAGLAFERWGAAGLGRLLGDYAIAAWDESTRELTLAGDPMGMRALYYWRQSGRALFSTTLPGLLRIPAVSRSLNEPYLADFIAMTAGDEESTFYRDIRTVRPGTAVVLKAAGVRTVEFYRFDAERRLRLADDASYVDAARELLDRVVADRQRAVVPVPLSASGGLDSACMAVSALAGGKPLTLLTAVPDARLPAWSSPMNYLDETPRVRALAAAFPSASVEFLAAPPDADWDPGSAAVFAAGATPNRGPGQIPWMEAVHRRASALGARSLLVGALGNLTLSWNGVPILPALLDRGRLLTLAREIVAGADSPRRVARRLKQVVIPFLPRDFSAASVAARSALHPDAFRGLGVLDRMTSLGDDGRFVFSRDHRRWRIHAIVKQRRRRPDSTNLMRALYGLDHTAPLGDVRMVEFCLAIPGRQFLHRGTSRRLARRLLHAAGAPSAIIDGEARGLQHPEWFAHLTAVRSALPGQIAALRRSTAATRLIDLDRLDRLIKDWPPDASAVRPGSLLFRMVLPRALHVGAFITWAEQQARR